MFTKNILILDWTQEGLRAKGPTKGKTVAQTGDKAGKEVAGHRGPGNLYQE